MRLLGPSEFLTGAGTACLAGAGALVHPALALAVVGAGLVALGFLAARRGV